MTSARILTGGIALFILFVPNFADWSTSHIFHDNWTGHARFHTVWQLMMQSAVAAVAIWLVIKGQVTRAAFLNLLVLGSFFLALGLLSAGLFDGRLTDLEGGIDKIAGYDANALAFSVLLFLQIVALIIRRS